MSSSFLVNMKLKRKMQVPNLLFLILLAATALLYFNSSKLLNDLSGKQQNLIALSSDVRNVSWVIKDFLNDKIDFDRTKTTYQLFLENLENDELRGYFKEAWTDIEKHQAIEKNNDEIGQQVMKLAADSIEQSNGFLKMISEKLAGEESRAEVSTLERLVIAGAVVNTSSNYEEMLLFLRLQKDISLKDDMLKFIDVLLTNVKKDIEQLSGSEFQGLALASQKNLIIMKELVLNYIDNVSIQFGLQANILKKTEQALARIDQNLIEQQAVFTSGIQDSFKLFVLVLIVISLIGILLNWITGRTTVKPIAQAVELAETIRSGIMSKRMKLDRTDEIGQLSTALDAMADVIDDKGRIVATIAEGDLTPEVEMASDQDQLGHSLQNMISNLNLLIRQVFDTTAQVAAGSSQVSDSSQALSQGATEQAASLEEITSSMTEMGSQTKSNAENASQANRLSIEARDAAENGNSQMQNMISAMSDITESSKEIAKIIKAIDDIAFQTNLLALNAAVEAARAGKHGKGFAVVAQEVRNLAGRSAKAAQETAELIDGSVKKVENGTSIVNKTASALGGIVESISKISDLVGEISSASDEQALGISQINQGLNQVELVTQQNTANAEETASAAEELNSRIKQLRQLVSRFKIKEGTTVEPTSPSRRSIAPKQIPQPQQPTESWGNRQDKGKADRVVEPKDLISLDDTDFDRF